MSTVEEHLQELIAKLKGRGYRLTPQRMAILRVLMGSQEHLTADEIYQRVKADFPMTSLATVYKTVALLQELGELWEVGFGQESSHYDGSAPFSHAHIVCRRCKALTDVQPGALDSLDEDVARRTGYRDVRHRLEFYGLCPQCQQEEGSQRR
ncbi:MAG: transcriptional repressor [Chloroflexi bacterium]|nr:transcriptional repressor [Chloroflexota bacterium]